LNEITKSMMKRSVFFISDGTGITAETLGTSLLSQFDTLELNRMVLPYIDTVDKAREAVRKINETRQKDGVAPIVFDTIVDRKVRDVLADCEGFMVDVFGTFLQPLEVELGTPSCYSVGRQRSISSSNNNYNVRIDAMNYALDNDDGGITRNYDEADIILVGVSRSGKTPTCLYLALQFGIRAANYPITEDDLEEMRLPKALKNFRNRLFGLTIDPTRLQAIRQERKPNSRYSSMRQCQMEVREAESMFRRERLPYLDSTHYSVEEIATRILSELGIQRHIR